MPPSYYPPHTLKDALAIGKTIYEKNGGKPMYRLTLAQEMDLKSEGRVFRELITASAGYGLTNGSYKSEKISLEERGGSVICCDIEATFDALFSNDLFKSFYEHFGSGGSKSVPSDKAANDFIRNVQQVPDRQIPGILECILSNARDWLLIQNLGGADKFVPIELAKETLIKSLGDRPVTEVPPVPPPPKPEQLGGTDGARKPLYVTPSLQLNIQIHIAADTPEAKIELIFQNMKKYLLTNEE